MGTLISSLLILFTSFQAYAQSINVSGVVKDEAGSPVVGVLVSVKGDKYITTTDIDGNFTIKANVNSTLVFSSLGCAFLRY